MHLYTEKRIPGFPSNISFYTALQAYVNMGFEIHEVTSPREIETVAYPNLFLGSIQFVYEALEMLGHPVPGPLDYPESLHDFLGRRITVSTIDGIANDPDSWNVFVKPKGFTKKFTGRLIRGTKDLVGCGEFGSNIPVWVSEPVDFVAEWRVYVRYGRVLGVKSYKGDWRAQYDVQIIEAAVNAYDNQPAAYSLDFGRTRDGRFLLVEANDGYALGSYGLFYVDYAKVLSARWAELTGQEDLCNF